MAGTVVALKIHINDKLNVLEEMAAEIRTRGREFSPKTMVDALSSFFQLKFYPGESTLKSVLDFICLKSDDFSGVEAANLAYLLAQFDVIEGSLSFFEDTRKKALSGALTSSPDEACALAWAFTITDRLDNELFSWAAKLVEALPKSHQSDSCKVRT